MPRRRAGNGDPANGFPEQDEVPYGREQSNPREIRGEVRGRWGDMICQPCAKDGERRLRNSCWHHERDRGDTHVAAAIEARI